MLRIFSKINKLEREKVLIFTVIIINKIKLISNKVHLNLINLISIITENSYFELKNRLILISINIIGISNKKINSLQ